MRGECWPGSLALSGADVGPRARSRSSVRPRFVDVKMRLIALWRQSLVRNERSRSWTLFSNSKKGIGRRSVTPPKRTIDVYYKVFRSFQERALCPSVASGNVLMHLPRSTPVRALQERRFGPAQYSVAASGSTFQEFCSKKMLRIRLRWLTLRPGA